MGIFPWQSLDSRDGGDFPNPFPSLANGAVGEFLDRA